jgi:hypothetical protein
MNKNNAAILQKQPQFKIQTKIKKDQAFCCSGIFNTLEGVDKGSGYLFISEECLIEGEFVAVKSEAKTADFVTESPMAESQIVIGCVYPYIYAYWGDQIQIILDRTRKWVRKKFQAEDAVEFQDQGTIVWRRKKDHPDLHGRKDINIIPKGWEHEHCQICMATICEEKGFEPYGYVDKNESWICETCYHKYVEPRCIDIQD